MKLPRSFKLIALSVGLTLTLTASGLGEPKTYLGDTIRVSTSGLIADVARDHGLAAEHLAWANGLEPTTSVAAGQKLKKPLRIIPSNAPTNGVVVNLAERGLYLFRDGKYDGFYPLSVGRQDNSEYATPTGEFKIISRVKNPEWKAPDSDWAEAMEKDKIAADSEENPLGEYWFGFNAPEGGLGFHENTAPSYTGDDISHGCLRMYPEHARYLYNKKLLMPGDPVIVVNEPIRMTDIGSGNPKMVVFPGLYDDKSSLNRAKRMLKSNGLLGLVSENFLKKQIKQKSGVPFSLLDGGIAIKNSDGSEIASGYLVDGQLVVPTALARELGLSAGYSSESGEIEIVSGEEKVNFPIATALDDEKAVAIRKGDATYVKARDLLEPFQIPFTWDSEKKVLMLEQSS